MSITKDVGRSMAKRKESLLKSLSSLEEPREEKQTEREPGKCQGNFPLQDNNFMAPRQEEI